MNNKKIGKLAVTGIITMLTAIWVMVSLEMAKDMKREIEWRVIKMGKEVTRKLTRDEKFAIQQSGRFWKDWMYL